MNDFMRATLISARDELSSAVSEHETAYTHGDWKAAKAANDRIEQARIITDAALYAAGKLRASDKPRCNQQIITLITFALEEVRHD